MSPGRITVELTRPHATALHASCRREARWSGSRPTICYAPPEWVAATIQRGAERATTFLISSDIVTRRARWRPLRRDAWKSSTSPKFSKAARH